MSFPTSPTNGQQATVNGIVYNYNSTKGAWIKTVTTAGTLTTGNLVITSNTASTNTTNGALIVTGGAGIQGNINAVGANAVNINASGTIVENTKRVATMSKAIAMSIVFGG
jgi:hypothetical protein